MMDEGKVAFVFPGQGSQRVGMGLDLYNSSAEARAVLQEANTVLGFPLTTLCFEGPETELRQTYNAQPAILAISIAYLRANSRLQDVVPTVVAGHSLGEYTALVAAHALDFSQGLQLARERGRLMQEAGVKVPGGMVAIIGMDELQVGEICRTTGTQIANINCPGQIAVTGTTRGIAEAAQLAKAKGARSAIPLQVSGAFHSRLMEPAAEGMSKAISRMTFKNPTVPVIANTTAEPITRARQVGPELLNQLCHCVQWQKSVERMVNDGVSTFVEVGPGQILTGLIKRIAKQAKAISTESSR
ncbi:MAG: ACP S-malonyltransferase [Chloroflexi bacterium]|nr:ACP S-malonyltransferase [Chloroflexota bacterium]